MRSRPLYILFLCFIACALVGHDCWDDDCHDHCDGHGCYRHCHDYDHYNDHYDSNQSSGSQVALLVTDHPIDDVDQLFVTIDDVMLYDEVDNEIPVYRSHTGHRIDLLSLRGDSAVQFYDLLTIQDVPPGVYESIGLSVRDPVMILSSGEILEGDQLDFVGGGAIEVALEAAIVLNRDETVHVVLDFDVSASLLDELATSESILRGIRPVILVDVLYDDFGDVVVTPRDLQGRLLGRDAETGLFGIDLPNDRGELELRLTRRAELMDDQRNFMSENDLRAGSDIQIQGQLGSGGLIEVERLIQGRLEGKNQGLSRVRDSEIAALSSSGFEVPTVIEGFVVETSPSTDSFLLLDEKGGYERVWLAPDTKIVWIETSDRGLWQTNITVSGLEMGSHVVAHGSSEDAISPRLVVVTSD